MPEKAVTYLPDWKQYRSQYIWSYAAIPLLGAGFYFLNRLDKKRQSERVAVYNDRIQFGEEPVGKTVYIKDLESVWSDSTAGQKKHGLASVHVKSDTGVFSVIGISLKEAENLESGLYLAIETEKKRRELRQKVKSDYDDTIKTGGLEHLNSLVGMWQQGLISEEDFEKEQRKFRK